MLNEVGSYIALSFYGGMAMLTIGFDISTRSVDFVGGKVKMFENNARGFERR